MDGFYKRVDHTGDCWVWLGARDEKGYGVLRVFGRNERAHRVAWILESGRIPPGMVVMHQCDNPRCVRPAHLSLGTVAENNDDMWAKGRGHQNLFGEAHSQARLTAEEVLAIRAAYTAGGITQRELAERYDISKTQIKDIINLRRWKHLAA